MSILDKIVEEIEKEDPEIASAIVNEKNRQNLGLELIPSENLASIPVLCAMATVLNNKYSEGLPGKRYYGGNQFIDVVENIAIERAKKLFGAEHVNVQPNSGSPANMAAYRALMNVGDTFMGMNLSHGGHLTHGHAVNFSGTLYKCVQYSVDKKTEMLDYDQIRKLAKETNPKVILCGYTAYPREFDFSEFKSIADDIGAKTMADIAHIAGLIAGGVHNSPFPFIDVVTTTTHKTLRGPRGAIIMCKKEFAEKVDKAVFPYLQGGPHEHVIAAKAVCFKEAAKPEFKNYAAQIVKNAKALAEELIAQGFRLVSGGTDNHLILVDVFSKGITGQQAENALHNVGIYVNKNTIPFDTRKPFDPSGIRIGTPVLTTRGMQEEEMKYIGELIAKVLNNINNTEIQNQVHEDVIELCQNFQFYK